MKNVRRGPNRKARRQRLQVVERLPPMAELAIAAGDSLELSDEEITDALNALSGFTPPGELSDTLQARLLELAELVQARSEAPEPLRLACASLDLVEARAELERRRGRGFVARVAAMGRPAAVALAGLLAAVVVLLLPSSAAALPASGADLISSHNVSRTRRRLSAAALNFARCCKLHHARLERRGRGWTQTRGSYARSGQRSTSFRSFAIGCARERATYDGSARISRSFWCGAVDCSALAASHGETRTLRSSAATGAWSARPGQWTRSAGAPS